MQVGLQGRHGQPGFGVRTRRTESRIEVYRDRHELRKLERDEPRVRDAVRDDGKRVCFPDEPITAYLRGYANLHGLGVGRQRRIQ